MILAHFRPDPGQVVVLVHDHIVIAHHVDFLASTCNAVMCSHRMLKHFLDSEKIISFSFRQIICVCIFEKLWKQLARMCIAFDALQIDTQVPHIEPLLHSSSMAKPDL